jgi:hypothetical protein
MWRRDEVSSIELTLGQKKKLTNPENATTSLREIRGAFLLETRDGKRGFEGELLGELEYEGEGITRFELVAKGEFWGEGQFTRNAPPGRFPFAVTFELADQSDTADAIPPQASRGWIDGYWRPHD